MRAWAIDSRSPDGHGLLGYGDWPLVKRISSPRPEYLGGYTIATFRHLVTARDYLGLAKTAWPRARVVRVIICVTRRIPRRGGKR